MIRRLVGLLWSQDSARDLTRRCGPDGAVSSAPHCRAGLAFALVVTAAAGSAGLAPQPVAAQGWQDRPWWEDSQRAWRYRDRPLYEDDQFVEREPLRRWRRPGWRWDERGWTRVRPSEEFDEDRRAPRPLPRWLDEPEDPAWSADEPDDERRSRRAVGVDGGTRPFIAPRAPPIVAFAASATYKPGSIVIDTGARRLYYVRNAMSAYAYPIGVGREGFAWTGVETVSRVADWPDWIPPAEMRKRKPELPERMLGGLNNPLGAKAIYLGNTLYRIHGTNDRKSIGRAESSGCFRMLNENVVHLASLVSVGTRVTVVRSLRGAVSPATSARPLTRPAPQASVRRSAEPRVRWSPDPGGPEDDPFIDEDVR